MELFNIEPEMASLLDNLSNEDLCSFAESQDDSASDDQTELYIYTCFLLFQKADSTKHLERGVQQAEKWVAITPTDHSDRTRRLQILNRMSAWVSTLEEGVQMCSEAK